MACWFYRHRRDIVARSPADQSPGRTCWRDACCTPGARTHSHPISMDRVTPGVGFALEEDRWVPCKRGFFWGGRGAREGGVGGGRRDVMVGGRGGERCEDEGMVGDWGSSCFRCVLTR